MKLVYVKLVEDVIWPECDLCVMTSDHREGSERLELIRRQVSKL